jgi:hypothetical protein
MDYTINFYFHKKERFIPVSLEELFECSIIENDVCTLKPEILKKIKKRQYKHSNTAVIYKFENDLNYHIYTMYYLYNPGTGLMNLFNPDHESKLSLGTHKYDQENIIVDPIKREVYYFQHDMIQKVPMLSNVINVYVANGSHASYPVSGSMYRYFMFACDRTGSIKEHLNVNTKIINVDLLNLSEALSYRKNFDGTGILSHFKPSMKSGSIVMKSTTEKPKQIMGSIYIIPSTFKIRLSEIKRLLF